MAPGGAPRGPSMLEPPEKKNNQDTRLAVDGHTYGWTYGKLRRALGSESFEVF